MVQETPRLFHGKPHRRPDENKSEWHGVGECAMNYIYQVAGERMLNPAMINDDGFFLRLYHPDRHIDQANAMGNGERARCPAHIRNLKQAAVSSR